MTRMLLMLMVAASAAMLAPNPAAASGCTDGYVRCLNDTYDLTGALRTLADVECFAAYSGCVARSFWVF